MKATWYPCLNQTPHEQHPHASAPNDWCAGVGEPRSDFRGVYEAAASLDTAERIAEAVEEYADDLEPPTTVEWLELRDWFKDLLHEIAARAREIGGAR